MQIFIFLSDLIGKKVVDIHDQPIGKLLDIVLKLNEEVYPKAECFLIKKGFLRKEYAVVKSEDILEIDGIIKLKGEENTIHYQNTPFKLDFTICRDILDQQVVDTDHQKVVRVNDVHFLRVDTQLYLAHVDVGLRGLVRRLEWDKFIDAVIRLFSPEASYLTKDELIPWKNTQVLSLGRSKNVLRLDIARKKLSQIPPTDLAEIMEDLDIFEKVSLFKSLDVGLQRKVFTDLPTQEKGELIDQLDEKEAIDLIENIPADEATDLLLILPKEKTRQWMRLMQTKTSKKLRKLLGFEKDSAGGLMTTEYLYLSENALVKDALQKIKENTQYPGNIYHIYIIDKKHRLVGTASLRQFINAAPEKSILDVCFPKRVFVRTDDGMEEIALLLEKYKFSSIPVLDEDDVLQGVITSDDVMEELISLTWKKYKDQL